MSDTRDAGTGLLAKLRQWAREVLIDEVPAAMAVCEFDCRKLECSHGDWETCENRLRGLRTDEA